MNDKRILTQSRSAKLERRRAAYQERKKKVLLLVETGGLVGGQKRCRKCETIKPFDDFYFDFRVSDYRRSECKECTRKADTDRWAKKLVTDLEGVLKRRRRIRIHRVFKAKFKTPEYRKLVFARAKARHPEKAIALWKVHNATKSGKLKRKPCSVCGKKAEAHHDDYSKPLNVRWLCRTHHIEHHVRVREQAIIQNFKAHQQTTNYESKSNSTES
jgi:hypothetical protein